MFYFVFILMIIGTVKFLIRFFINIYVIFGNMYDTHANTYETHAHMRKNTHVYTRRYLT